MTDRDRRFIMILFYMVIALQYTNIIITDLRYDDLKARIIELSERTR